MFNRWRERLRSQWIKHLRPGRDENELLALIGRAEAVQSDDHRRMLESLVMFHDVRVRELMVPRSEIFALETNMPLKDAARKIAGNDYSKLPVYVDNLDNIKGVIHAWDVFSAEIEGKNKHLSSLIRPCLKVPESQLALGLLDRMKEKGAHLAIVMDEYGGTGGLVTLADLLTEIVGSMDEVGEAGESEECVRNEDGGYVVSGRLHVEDLEEVLKRPLPKGDYDTVGGLVTSLCGRIPAKGEHIEVAGLMVHVLAAEPRRVLKLHITPMERNSSLDKKAEGRLDARKGGAQALRTNGPNQMGQSGDADRRS